MDYRILIVDDEPDILEFVGYNLRREGYEVHTASNGREAVAAAGRIDPHLVVLDVMMPEMDGLETCRMIRTHKALKSVPVIFLTAKGEEESQIGAFEVGADDYIVKPVHVKVLMSRIRAVLKRAYGAEEGVTARAAAARACGTEEGAAARAVEIDTERHLVIRGGEELVLPRKEFNLLRLLYSRPQKVFSREEIYKEVWGSDVVVGDRTIDVHVRRLREKIGEHHIITIKGVGYKFEE